MTNLLNKSNHPVEVKKVKVRIWTLRSEIESAITEKLQESESQDLSTLDIQDIQTFYHNHVPAKIESEIAEEESASDDTNVAKLTDEVLSENSESSEPSEDSENNDDTKEEAASKKEFVRPIPNDDLVFHGELLLSDLHMDKVTLFTNRKFTQGQNLIIQFMITSPFVISGEVKHVVNFARNSKIIKETKLDHRLHIGCSLLFPNERTKLREFLLSIEPTIPATPKKHKAKSESDEEDDFDDLGL